MLSYNDAWMLLLITFICVSPAILLLRRPQVGYCYAGRCPLACRWPAQVRAARALGPKTQSKAPVRSIPTHRSREMQCRS